MVFIISPHFHCLLYGLIVTSKLSQISAILKISSWKFFFKLRAWKYRKRLSYILKKELFSFESFSMEIFYSYEILFSKSIYFSWLKWNVHFESISLRMQYWKVFHTDNTVQYYTSQNEWMNEILFLAFNCSLVLIQNERVARGLTGSFSLHSVFD